MKRCIKFWELVFLLGQVTTGMADGTTALSSYTSQNQYSSSGQTVYSTTGTNTGNGQSNSDGQSYAGVQPYSNGQTPETRMCGSYINGSMNGITDYNVNGGDGGSADEMRLYGLQIIDPEMVKYLQSNYIGRDRKYDDFKWNDGYSCARDCCRYKRPRLCYYHFTVEQYTTMGPACGTCGLGNRTDCMKKQCIIADGVERTVISVNRMVPGPLMWACKGDKIVCDVSNVAPSSSVTIHWHGVLQKGTCFMDGVPMVTQCSIEPMGIFRYEFMADEAGTNFWHSHAGRLQSNGVFGGLVIDKCNNPNKHLHKHNKPTHVMVINDWNHALSDDKYPGAYSNLSNVMAQPNSYLINGQGNYMDAATQTNTPLYEIHVKSDGEGNLIRVIAASVHVCTFKMAIEGHTMTVVANDGYPCKPKDFNTIVLGGGERLDFVVKTKKIPLKCRYSIIVKGMQECERAYAQKGWFVYDDCPEVPDLPPLLERILEIPPYYDDTDLGCDRDDVDCAYEMESTEQAPTELQCGAPTDETYFLYMGFHTRPYAEAFESKTVPFPMFYLPGGPSGVYVDTVNRIMAMMPTHPLLTQDNPYDKRLVCPTTCEKDICMCLNMKHLKTNSTVRLYMHDQMGLSNIRENHPMHIHGHHWNICYQGSKQEREDEPDTYYLKHTNSTYPVQRDMVVIPNGGWATVVFKADNPGYWMMHCHFEDHAVTGMSMIFEVGDRCEMKQPGPGFPKCGVYLPKVNNLTSYERPPNCTSPECEDPSKYPR